MSDTDKHTTESTPPSTTPLSELTSSEGRPILEYPPIIIDECETPPEVWFFNKLNIAGQLLEFSEIKAEDIKPIKYVRLPNYMEIHSIGAFIAKCPSCGTEQLSILDQDQRQVMFFCAKEERIIVGSSPKPVVVVNFG